MKNKPKDAGLSCAESQKFEELDVKAVPTFGLESSDLDAIPAIQTSQGGVCFVTHSLNTVLGDDRYTLDVLLQ